MLLMTIRLGGAVSFVTSSTMMGALVDASAFGPIKSIRAPNPTKHKKAAPVGALSFFCQVPDNRHCEERQRRSNPAFFNLDCFAYARNDALGASADRCPSGKIRMRVMRELPVAPIRRNPTILPVPPNQWHLEPSCTQQEGRTRRHEREAGCDGREGVVRRMTSARTAKSCGPGAPWLASSWRRCFASRRRR